MCVCGRGEGGAVCDRGGCVCVGVAVIVCGEGGSKTAGMVVIKHNVYINYNNP